MSGKLEEEISYAFGHRIQANIRRNEKNHKLAMRAPLYRSYMSGPRCNCIDIPTVNIRGSSFHYIIMNFYVIVDSRSVAIEKKNSK